MTTPRTGLPEWAAAQASPWTPHNEALRKIDALVSGAVIDRGLAAEPGSPAEGAAYILPASPTGAAWGSFAANDIAIFTNGGWINVTPLEGFRLWVSDENQICVFDGTNWGPLTAAPSVNASEFLGIACSDEVTALIAATGVATFRAPYALTLTDVRASLTTAQASGSIFTVDINVGGASILSTKLTIDNTEKTSTTAATAAVISAASIADDAEISIDIDQVGSGEAAGLKVTLIGAKP